MVNSFLKDVDYNNKTKKIKKDFLYFKIRFFESEIAVPIKKNIRNKEKNLIFFSKYRINQKGICKIN